MFENLSHAQGAVTCRAVLRKPGRRQEGAAGIRPAGPAAAERRRQSRTLLSAASCTHPPGVLAATPTRLHPLQKDENLSEALLLPAELHCWVTLCCHVALTHC